MKPDSEKSKDELIQELQEFRRRQLQPTRCSGGWKH